VRDSQFNKLETINGWLLIREEEKIKVSLWVTIKFQWILKY